jgi:hypothetical protein
VAKLNGHMEEVRAAIEHEADKLKAFEADQAALKGRCGLFTIGSMLSALWCCHHSAQVDIKSDMITGSFAIITAMPAALYPAAECTFCAGRTCRKCSYGMDLAHSEHLYTAAPRMRRRR